MGKSGPDEIEEVLIREIATILAADRSTIRAEVPLPSLGIDSVTFIEVLVIIEETYGLRLVETELRREDFQTIRSMATCIGKLI